MQFGRPVGTFRALSHRLAEFATELECPRLLVHDVAQFVDENPGKPMPQEASMVKLQSTELAERAALEGIRMMGGMGCTQEGIESLPPVVRTHLHQDIYGSRPPAALPGCQK